MPTAQSVFAVLLLCAVCPLCAGEAWGQTTTSAPAPASTDSPPTDGDDAANAWSFSASASTYIQNDSGAYVQPTLIADRDWLHLEARFNYEGLNTASLWAGYNLSFGEKLVLDLTPMIGGVFGDTSGVAPGYRLALTYGRFELSSEGEYLLDCGGSSGNFFYCWTEARYAPVEWFWFGLAAQRTRAYESDLDVQPGVLVGAAWKSLNCTVYLFNIGLDDPTLVVSVGIDF